MKSSRVLTSNFHFSKAGNSKVCPMNQKHILFNLKAKPLSLQKSHSTDLRVSHITGSFKHSLFNLLVFGYRSTYTI